MPGQGDNQFTWDDLKAAVGKDFSDGSVKMATDAVERWAIRAFCEPMEMDCPLHWDDDEARKWGYKGIIAPFSSISGAFSSAARWTPSAPTRWPDPHREDAHLRTRDEGSNRQMPMPPTSHGFNAGLELEYYRPVYVGDRLKSRGHRLISMELKETSVGFGAFIVTEHEILNQNDELVAAVRGTGFRYNPHPKKGEKTTE